MSKESFCASSIAFDCLAYERWVEECARENRENTRADMSGIVRMAVASELTKQQQEMLKLHWNLGLSCAEIARIKGLSRSTVSRQVDKIAAILRERLKYAVTLYYGADGLSLLERSVTTASGDSDDLRRGYGYIGARLQSLRTIRGMTLEQVSKGAGISKLRLERLEKEGGLMTVCELFGLAVFFGVSTDYIVYGSERA